MTKFKKSILIFGILALIIGVALGTFIVLSLTGSLKSERVAIEFTVENAEKTYDGEPLKATGCKITAGNLIEGHTPIVSFTGEQTDVGIGFSGLDVQIVDESGYDVTKDYKIKVKGGILLVDYCNLRVNLTARDVIYDGNVIDIGDGYSVMGGMLAPGHKVSLQINDDWLEDAGKTVADKTLTYNDVKALITDANGRNVTDNYKISLAGKVNIVKRSLVINPVSAEKVYDGRPLVCSQYKIEYGSLASGHYIVAEFSSKDGRKASVVNVSDCPLEVVMSVTIRDIDDDDVTANYRLISDTVAYLTINKAPLTIVAKSASWEYDGLAHTLITDTEVESAIGLVHGDTVSVQYSGSVTGVAVAENKIEKYFINGKDDDWNYEVTCKNGKLEVTKAQVFIKWESLKKEYDGNPFTIADKKLYTVNSAIKDLELQFDKDEFEQLFADVTIPGISTYTFSDFEIYNGTRNITEMCNITVISGNLTITRRNVSFSGNSLSKVYDGNLTFTDGISIDSLAYGNSFVSATLSPTEEDYTANKQFTAQIKEIYLVDRQGNNVSGYYNITNFDTLLNVTIKPRSLKISTNTVQKVYDGTPLNGGSPLCGQLASGDSVDFVPFEITNVAESADNKPEIKIFNSNGKDVTEFYNPEENYGKLIILPKPVTVYFSEVFEVEYKEGGIQSLSLLDYIKCNELDADNFYFGNTTYNSVGLQEVTFAWRTEEEDIKQNHTIIQGNNKFLIIKGKLTATLPVGACKTYNNKPLTKDDILKIVTTDKDATLISSTLVDKVDADTYSAEIVYETEHFQYTVTGSYTIDPVQINIVLNYSTNGGVFTKIYDGKAFNPEEKYFKVESDLDEELYVKSYTTAGDDIIDVVLSEDGTAQRQQQRFASFELMFADTDIKVKAGNVDIDLSQFYVEVVVTQRKLDVYIETIISSRDNLNMVYNQDISKLIHTSNLIEGDEVIFINRENGETVQELADHFNVSVAGSELYVDIQVWRDGKNISDSYILPEEITGIVNITG